MDQCNLPPGVEIESGLVWEEGNERPNLGPCCACGGITDVDALITIRRKSLLKGRGAWGCFVCGAKDGAAVVLCTRCRTEGTPVKWGCRGRPGEDGRAPIEEFTEPCSHDLAKHPEVLCRHN